MNLATYLKLEGVRSVKALAEHEGVTVRTMQNWWNDESKRVFIEAALKRYKEGKK